jgi:hypothetical protein
MGVPFKVIVWRFKVIVWRYRFKLLYGVPFKVIVWRFKVIVWRYRFKLLYGGRITMQRYCIEYIVYLLCKVTV